MTALITGASGGLGAEFARLFAADGYNLILVARGAEKLAALKAELESAYRITVTILVQDLTKTAAPQTVFDFTQSNNLAVDVLVNNAGFGDWGFFAQSNLAKQQQMVRLNITALMTVTHLFLPQMISRGNGRILNVASIASFMPGAKMAVYYASKAFVRSFSEALAVELKKSQTGVTVTALCPGPVSTDFWNKAEAQGSSIFQKLFFAKSEKVALYGYKKLMKGKVLAIPNVSTNFFIFCAKILPRSFMRNVIYNVQK